MSRRGFLTHAAAAGAAGALPTSTSAQQGSRVADTGGLKVLSAGSTLYGLRPCAEIFTRNAGIAVHLATDHGHNIHQAALRGAADVDLVVLPTDRSHRSSPRVLPTKKRWCHRRGAHRRRRARGRAAPRRRHHGGVGRTLLAADAVLLTLAPTGDHLMQVIARMGLADSLAGKLKRFDTATLLNRHLAETANPGAIGFGPATEIKSWEGKGVAWAGAIPDEVQVVLPYAAAMLIRTQASEAARALLAFLATPAAREHFLASGVE